MVRPTDRRQMVKWLLAIEDMFSRECLIIEVDTSLPGKRVVRALERLIQSRGKPERLLIDSFLRFFNSKLLIFFKKGGLPRGT